MKENIKRMPTDRGRTDGDTVSKEAKAAVPPSDAGGTPDRKLLRSGKQIFVAIQQTHDLAFIHEALIQRILGNGIEQLALATDFLKQLNAIAMRTFPDFLAHDELAQIHFAGEAGLFDLLLQVVEFASVQTDNNGMISFPQRSTPLLFFFMGLF